MTLRDAPPEHALDNGLASDGGGAVYEALEDSSAESVRGARCAIVTFEATTKAGLSSVKLAEALAQRKIGVSVSPATHTCAHEARPILHSESAVNVRVNLPHHANNVDAWQLMTRNGPAHPRCVSLPHSSTQSTRSI